MALTEVASVQPQAAFCAFIMVYVVDGLMFLEHANCQFIPSLTGRDAPNDLDQDWFSLPY